MLVQSSPWPKSYWPTLVNKDGMTDTWTNGQTDRQMDVKWTIGPKKTRWTKKKTRKKGQKINALTDGMTHRATDVQNY